MCVCVCVCVFLCVYTWASPVVFMVKNPPANAGDLRVAGSILGWGRSPGGGSNNSLQYSCLENPMDRGAWWATVHGYEKNWAQVKRLSMCAHTHVYINKHLFIYNNRVPLWLS